LSWHEKLIGNIFFRVVFVVTALRLFWEGTDVFKTSRSTGHIQYDKVIELSVTAFSIYLASRVAEKRLR